MTTSIDQRLLIVGLALCGVAALRLSSIVLRRYAGDWYRWTAWIIDVGFLLFGFQHWAWLLLAVCQYWARRNPTVARGFLSLARVRVVRPWHVWLLPGAAELMSNPAPVPTGASTSAAPVPSGPAPVPKAPGTALESAEPGLVPTATALIAQHNLEPRQAAELLAVLQKPDGEYYLSANEICKVVGGREATVKAWIRAKRPAPAAQQGRFARPTEGW